MKKSVKIALVAGVCFLLVGLALWGVSTGTDEFKRLASSEAESGDIITNREALAALLSEDMSEYSYMASEQVSVLDISLKTRSVYIVSADVSDVEIKSAENEASRLKVSLEGGALKLQEELKKNIVNISDFFSFDFSDKKSTDRSVYIYLPRNTELESLKTGCSHGKTSINGFHADELIITSDNGDIDISSISAKSAAIDTSFGYVDINKLTVEGMLAVTTDNGRINISKTNSFGAEVESSFGNISLSEVSLSTGGLKIINSNGDIAIKNMAGVDVHVSTSFGDIDIDDASVGSITAESKNGDIDLEEVFAAAVKLITSFGSIEAENSSLGSLYAESDNGAVKIEGGDIPSIEAKTSFGSIEISSTSFTSCVANSQNGKVALEKLPISQSETSIKAKASSGSVSINGEKQASSYEKTLSGAKAEIDAETSFGDISISFR